MKRTILQTIVMILFLLYSCQKEPAIHFGFDTDFGKNSHGLTIMHAKSNTKTINLIGNIVVREGEVLVALTNPSGEVLFKSRIKAPDVLRVNETFQASKGNWSLKYSSHEGEGTLVLHLSIVN